MRALTKREIFDKVKAHLLTQNARALDKNGKSCMYLAPDGKKCAVGILIPDGHEIQRECINVCGLFEQYTDFCTAMFGIDNRRLLTDLQSLHDKIHVEDWPAAFDQLERQHRIPPAPVKCVTRRVPAPKYAMETVNA